MSILVPSSPQYYTSYGHLPCTFRSRHPLKPSSTTFSPLSMSWCAHHGISNIKNCNLHQPCIVIPSIVQDASFRIQTALLWIRSDAACLSRVTTGSLSSDTPSDLPPIVLNDAIDGRSSNDAAIFVRDDKPDLGFLHLHRDRLAAAAEALGWRGMSSLRHSVEALRELKDKIEDHMEGRPPLAPSSHEMCKVRIFVDKIGNITIDSTVLQVETSVPNSGLLNPFMPISFDQSWHPEMTPCRVYVDEQPTRPSALTTHKSTHRCVYATARQRLKLAPTTSPTDQEVLLYNPYGEVTETSCCTVYFRRDSTWITPAAICGPTLGVSRRLAIEEGLCVQGTIELRELIDGEEIWLSNAVRGFFKGILVTDPKASSENFGGQQPKSINTES